MTARDHNKLLGIFFAIFAALQGVGALLVVVIYGGLGAFIATSGKDDEKFFGVFFLVAAIFAFLFSLVIVVPPALAAYKMLKNRGGARFWAIFASIVALIGFPLGTALGVYGLWFLFGEQGKQFYSNNSTAFAPPPPPNSWQ